jgi:hypothetical protein
MGAPNQATRWVLAMLLEEPARHWSRCELRVALSIDLPDLDDAISALSRCGLAHRNADYVFASRAATEFHRLGI